MRVPIGSQLGGMAQRNWQVGSHPLEPASRVTPAVERNPPGPGPPGGGPTTWSISELPFGVPSALLHPVLIRLDPPGVVGAVLQVLLRDLGGFLEPGLAENQLAIAH